MYSPQSNENNSQTAAQPWEVDTPVGVDKCCRTLRAVNVHSAMYPRASLRRQQPHSPAGRLRSTFGGAPSEQGHERNRQVQRESIRRRLEAEEALQVPQLQRKYTALIKFRPNRDAFVTQADFASKYKQITGDPIAGAEVEIEDADDLSDIEFAKCAWKWSFITQIVGGVKAKKCKATISFASAIHNGYSSTRT